MAGGLGLRDLCDTVYALQVDQIERMVLAALSAGADVRLDEALADYERRLNEPPKARDQFELLRALHVA